MPNRIISEKCRTSPTLDALSSDAERTFWRLVTVADDYGRFDADPRVVLSTCFPLRAGAWTADRMAALLNELARQSGDDEPLVELYRVKGRIYGQIRNFLTYQRKRESKPKFPPPDEGERIMPPQVAASCGEQPQVAAKCRESRQVAALSESVSESRETRVGRRESRHAPQVAATLMAQLRSFALTPELRLWAQREGINNPDVYVDEWRDYWLSVGGIRRNGRPLRDLAAAFRNSLRNLKAQGKLGTAVGWKEQFLAQEGSA